MQRTGRSVLVLLSRNETLLGSQVASLPNIMKAKKKPLDSRTASDLGVDIEPRLTIVKVEEPETRAAGVKVADVQELVNKLKNEAKVI